MSIDVGLSPRSSVSTSEPDVRWQSSEDNVHIILYINDLTTVVDYMDMTSLSSAITLVSNLPGTSDGALDTLQVLRTQYEFLAKRETLNRMH